MIYKQFCQRLGDMPKITPKKAARMSSWPSKQTMYILTDDYVIGKMYLSYLGLILYLSLIPDLEGSSNLSKVTESECQRESSDTGLRPKPKLLPTTLYFLDPNFCQPNYFFWHFVLFYCHLKMTIDCYNW